jgi:hypothetical protein
MTPIVTWLAWMGELMERVGEEKTEVRRQRSEGRGQKAEVRRFQDELSSVFCLLTLHPAGK